MRAVRLHAFGQPLQVDDVPEPEPGPGEALVLVRYASVNPLDVWLTDGTVAGGRQQLPIVPGAEGVGEIDGRPVLVHGLGLGVTRDGLYQERAAVPVDATLPLPEAVDLQQAAGVGVAGATAWALVHDLGGIESPDHVLVLGASGGVGSLVVQLARKAGATVWGHTSSAEKAYFVEGLGADRVIVASADELAGAASDLEATVAVDPLGDGYTVAAIDALRPFGRLLLYGASAGGRAEIDLRATYRKAVQVLTYSGTIEPPDRLRLAERRALEALARGDLRVPVDEVLPLDQAPEAHRRIREREVKGKLLLQP